MKANSQSHRHDILKMSNLESNQFTKNCIKTALLQLLSESTFDRITVTAIIQRSGVSRAGFYRNYSSKESVMEELAVSLCHDLMAFMNNDNYQGNPKQWFTDLFTGIRNNADIFHLLLQANIPKEFADSAGIFFENIYSGKVADERYYAIALASSLREIVIDWFRHGMKEEPVEMAELFVNLFLR